MYMQLLVAQDVSSNDILKKYSLNFRMKFLNREYLILTDSIATKFEASWNRWMLMRSKTVPFKFQRVRMKPLRDHLHCKLNKR